MLHGTCAEGGSSLPAILVILEWMEDLLRGEDTALYLQTHKFLLFPSSMNVKYKNVYMDVKYKLPTNTKLRHATSAPTM
jgi:hypothetical protein